MKKQLNYLFFLVSITLLSSCSASDEIKFSDQRQGPLEIIQSKLRSQALDNWEKNLPTYVSKNDLPAPSQSNEPSEPAKNDPVTVAWREKIGESWKDLQGQKNLDFMCQLWFEGWLGLSESFADMFKEHRAKTEAMGIKIETIENIKMIADNRKTINYPQPGKQYSIFTCEATTVFRMARPGLTKPAQSTISFTYYLENNQVKSRFSVGTGLSTEATKELD
jgi:hypothetical protein